ITPAYAGKSKGILQNVDITTGSPPHTREKALVGEWNRRLIRITPAYAGKSF
ncbi:hypothetical protein HMPREF3187_01271, partial [Aerococcus christensenii]